MATTSRGPKGRSTGKQTNGRGQTKTAARPKRAPADSSPLESVRETAGGYAGNFLKTVRSRPYAAAALAAGTAGAAAFLWAKRAVIGEQAAAAGEKIGDLREQASEKAGTLRDGAGDRARAFRGKLNERFFATEEATDIDAEGETQAQSGRGRRKKTQSDFSQEALSLKQIGERDSQIDDQSKVGAIAY